jgi:hypothetical protein
LRIRAIWARVSTFCTLVSTSRTTVKIPRTNTVGKTMARNGVISPGLSATRPIATSEVDSAAT